MRYLVYDQVLGESYPIDCFEREIPEMVNLAINLKLRRSLRSLTRGSRNIIYWWKTIWNTNDWDYAYLYHIMSVQLKRMSNRIEKEKRHVGYEKDVRRMKIAAELCDRITGDKDTGVDYFKNMNLFIPERTMRDSGIKNNYMFKIGYGENDYKDTIDDKFYMEYLHKLMNKYSRQWWD